MAGDVSDRDRGFGSGDANRMDEEVHAVLLTREDMLDASADLGFFAFAWAERFGIDLPLGFLR